METSSSPFKKFWYEIFMNLKEITLSPIDPYVSWDNPNKNNNNQNTENVENR